MKKKVLSLVLALILCLTLAAPALAADSDFVIENGVLTEYNGPGGDVIIPDGVTRIGDHTFLGCDSLTSVIIPGSVDTIGWNAFINCSGLKSVTISDGVTCVWDWSFAGCDSLSSVTIPGSVNTIGRCAFAGSNNLTDIYYGGTEAQWKRIGIGMGNENLQDVTIHYNSTGGGKVEGTQSSNSAITAYRDFILNGEYLTVDYSSIDDAPPGGWGYEAKKTFALYDMDKDGTPELFIYNGDASHLCSHDYIFTYTNGKIQLLGACPAYPKYFPGTKYSGIFANRHVGAGLGGGHYVTKEGNSLKDEIVYTYNNHTGGTLDQRTSNGELYRLVVSPDGHLRDLERIYDASLAEINSMGWDKFVLKALPDFSAQFPFANVTGGKIYFNASTGAIIDCDKSVTEAIIPSAINGVPVTAIGDEAFMDCLNLTNVTIPSGVTTIGNRAFVGCSSLTSVTIPKSVNAVGNRAFDSCSSLTSVTILGNITSIEAYTFCMCKKLSSISIPSSVTTVNQGAFFMDNNLKDVYYGGSESQWKQITIWPSEGSPYSPLFDATIHYNSNVPTPTIPGFSDVSADAWYADAVAWAVEKGVTNGTGNNTFSPDKTCNTAEILTFLWRACDKPRAGTAGGFSDVAAGIWYADAAAWAKSKGMVSGPTLSPESPCTRASAVMFIWQAMGKPPASSPASFKDVPANSVYANAVAWAVEKGVTNGTGKDTFSPDTTCTRGHIVTFLNRAFA